MEDFKTFKINITTLILIVFTCIYFMLYHFLVFKEVLLGILWGIMSLLYCILLAINFRGGSKWKT